MLPPRAELLVVPIGAKPNATLKPNEQATSIAMRLLFFWLFMVSFMMSTSSLFSAGWRLHISLI